MARFDEVKATFWDSYPPTPPATEEDIAQVQRALGVKLPAELVELLRIRDGGGVNPDWGAFPVSERTAWSGDHVVLNGLMGTKERPSVSPLTETAYLVEEWDLPAGVVLVEGDGHWWIGLDYRACGPDGEPGVVWLEPDDTGQEPPVAWELPLAKDFRTFVEGLVPFDTFDEDEEDQP